MYEDRNEFLVAAVELREYKLLPQILADIKGDIFKAWLATTDKEELYKLHLKASGLDLILCKLQDYANELDVKREEWDNS